MVQPGMSEDQIKKLWPKVVFAKLPKMYCTVSKTYSFWDIFP